MISRLMDPLFHLLLYAGELFKLKACFWIANDEVAFNTSNALKSIFLIYFLF